MALAIDASTPALASNSASATTTLTSAAFSPPAGSFILVMTARDSAGATVNEQQVISSTPALTWTIIGRKTDYASATSVIAGGTNEPGDIEMWWAYTATAPGSTTVSTALASGATAADAAMQVVVLTGAETTFGGAKAASGNTATTPSVAVTTTAANSWVFSMSTDWTAGVVGTVGAGQTIINQVQFSGLMTYNFWRQTATTASSGTAVTNNLTAPASQQWNEIAVEVRPGAVATPNPLAVRAVTTVPRIRAAHF